MKRSIISAAIALCSIPAAFSCEIPRPDAATLFSMIANPKTQVSDVRNFLKSHAIGWDAVNENCQTTFLASLAQNRNDLFETLYDQYKPDLNQPQPENRDSIYTYVITQGTADNLKTVQSVGKHLSLPQDTKTAGTTELMLAAQSNPHVDMIQYLLNNGFSVGTKDKDHQTALLYAAPSASLDVIQALIHGHSNVNQVGSNGDTPLSLAAKSNPDHQVVYALVKAGATIDTKLANDMLSSEASRRDGDIDLMKNLIQRGAGVNGGGILSSAVQSTLNPDIVTMLIQAGASVNSEPENYAGTILMLASVARLSSSPEIVKILIQSGADVNATMTGNESALLLVVETGRYDDSTIEVIRELVQAGANLTLTYQTDMAQRFGYTGQTALQFATNHGASAEVLKLLGGQ